MKMDGANMNGEPCVRSIEDVETMLGHAKLSSCDILPESQILYFGNNDYEYKLLELNGDILESFKNGESITFRGVPGKKAVLCNGSQTFEILEAETSNSSLLIPDLNINNHGNAESENERCIKNRSIECVLYSYYELRKIKPPFLYELESLLQKCLYNGPENEDESSQSLYSVENLLNLCQSSASEMECALESIGAISINGHWRLLHFEYHLRAFTQILSLIDSNSWPLDRIPESETVESLKDIFPEIIIRHVLSLYAEPLYERNEEGDALFTFKEDKVCRFLGEALLRDGDVNGYDLDQFIKAWSSSVPEGMNADIKQLTGLAVIVENPTSKLQEIRLCDEKVLPRDIRERVNYLFTIKKKWTLDELSPYVISLLPHKANIKATLMKFANEITEDGLKLYVRRL